MSQTERKRQVREIHKNDIIDAAEKVFFQKGYENASMDEIAREAEFSKRTIYVYFNGKEEIYYQIMNRGYRLLLTMLEQNLEKEHPQTSRHELQCIFFTFCSFREQYTNYFKAIMEYETKDCDEQTGLSDDLKSECYLMGEQVLRYLRNALDMGILEGILASSLDSKKTALILWAFMTGVFIASEKKCDYITNYHHISVQDFIASAFDLAMNMIGERE